MPTGETSAREAASEVLGALPDSVTANDILLAIHHRLNLDDQLETAKSLHAMRTEPPSQSAFSAVLDSIGCFIPFLIVPLIFVAMPLCFSLGEKIIQRPLRTIDNGTIKSIALNNGADTSGLVGRSCKVFSSHLVVEMADGTTTVIPAEAYSMLKISDE